MKHFVILFVLLFATAAAHATTNLRIGYVNTEKVFRDSRLAVNAQKKLEREFQGREQEIQKLIKQARDLQTTLEREGLTLGEADRVRRQNELSTLSRNLQHAQREFREDLNQRKNEEFAVVQERARKAIQDIAEKERFDLILENVVYASPRVDITERVLRVLER